MNNDKVIFATLQHGGHLGFFEGGLVVPETITWLDKIVVQYADAVAMTMIKTSWKQETVEHLSKSVTDFLLFCNQKGGSCAVCWVGPHFLFTGCVLALAYQYLWC